MQLHRGFSIRRLEISNEPLVDAIGREAVALTRIVGHEFDVLIRAGLSERELSVTIYHEVLEAVTVATDNPPPAVRQFNEGDFERAAYEADNQLGKVSRENLDRMLQLYGF